MRALQKLRRFAQPAPRVTEKCELCGAAIDSTHQHVIDLEKRRMMCTCRACFLLFTQVGAAGGKLRSVSERYLKLPKLEIPGDEIPVGIAFFIRDSATNLVKAFYPSPAGPVEAGITVEAWAEMIANAPALAGMEPDVEAALIGNSESWIVPVDACYELVGRMKRTWRGFDGGPEARGEIAGFFAGLVKVETRFV